MCYVKNYQEYDGQPTKIGVWARALNKWSSVSKAIRGINDPLVNGTFQIITPGDLALISTKCPHTGEVIVTIAQAVICEENSDGSLAYIQFNSVPVGTEILDMISGVTNSLELWLKDLGPETGGYIPSGIGWDGRYTLYDQRKRDKITALLYGVENEELISRIVEAGLISSSKKISLNWADAIALPINQKCELQYNVGDMTLEVFAIQWFKDNRTEVTWLNIEDLVENKCVVSPDANKVMIGSINQGADPDKVLTRWELYSK